MQEFLERSHSFIGEMLLPAIARAFIVGGIFCVVMFTAMFAYLFWRYKTGRKLGKTESTGPE